MSHPTGFQINAETESFLASATNLVLGTIRRDGAPQASPVWFLWTGEAFVISTITRTAKWWNLKRDSRCSVCVDEPDTGRMVVAYGTAELADEDVRDGTRELVARYYPGEPEKVEPHLDRIFTRQRRVLITVRPDRLITRGLGE